MKICNVCNSKFKTFPTGEKHNLRYSEHGAYWECHCRSTMFVPNKKFHLYTRINGFIASVGRQVVTVLSLIFITSCSTVPKLTLHERCQADHKRYGGMKQCMIEKRQEDIDERLDEQEAAIGAIQHEQMLNQISNGWNQPNWNNQ